MSVADCMLALGALAVCAGVWMLLSDGAAVLAAGLLVLAGGVLLGRGDA